MLECLRARFIVLEGLDGVGKSTLVEGLATLAGGVAMSTPGKRFSDTRQEILHALGDDQFARALFFSATVSSQGRRAQDIVANGRSVFMDRYWASTVAYARARGVKANLDALTTNIVCPDEVVLISLDESERCNRLEIRGMTDEDSETLNPAFNAIVSRELEERCSVKIDVTGLDERAAIARLVKALAG